MFHSSIIMRGYSKESPDKLFFICTGGSAGGFLPCATQRILKLYEAHAFLTGPTKDPICVSVFFLFEKLSVLHVATGCGYEVTKVVMNFRRLSF